MISQGEKLIKVIRTICICVCVCVCRRARVCVRVHVRERHPRRHLRNSTGTFRTPESMPHGTREREREREGRGKERNYVTHLVHMSWRSQAGLRRRGTRTRNIYCLRRLRSVGRPDTDWTGTDRRRWWSVRTCRLQTELIFLKRNVTI